MTTNETEASTTYTLESLPTTHHALVAVANELRAIREQLENGVTTIYVNNEELRVVSSSDR